MFLDIIVAGILILFIARGASKGFVYTFIHTLGWIGALIISFLAAKPLAGFLEDGFIGILIRESISQKLSGSANAVGNSVSALPDIVSGGIDAGMNAASDIFVNLLTSMVLTMVSFVIIMAAARFLLRILVRPASRRYGGGMLNTADKALGGVAGAIEGILLVFLFLAVLVILVNLFSEGMSEIVVEWLEGSLAARALYDNNLLMLVTGGFFG